MRRKEMRQHKARRAQAYRGRMARAREVPSLVFVEREVLREPVAVELVPGRPASRGLAGFWRGTDFYRVARVVETRWEHDAVYYRVITERGCFDLRRFREMDAWTMRVSVVWELTSALDAAEVTRPL